MSMFPPNGKRQSVSPLRRAVDKLNETVGRRGLWAVLDKIDINDPRNYRPIYTNTIEWKLYVANMERLIHRDMAEQMAAWQHCLFGDLS
jgi:hypothetical protein